MPNKYESEALLRQYLDFHYRGEDANYLPLHPLPPGVLAYPRRCADWTMRHATRFGRALDLGCAVGGASFVLARSFDEVVGIDFSESFIATAQSLAQTEVFRSSEEEWVVFSELRKTVPQFLVGDACSLPEDLGEFDAVLMANLLCRLPDPAACLEELRRHVRSGAVLVFMTPCSWDEAFTPKVNQLIPTLEALTGLLKSWCDLVEVRDMPFVLRDHVRRAEFTVAQGSVWRVK